VGNFSDIQLRKFDRNLIFQLKKKIRRPENLIPDPRSLLQKIFFNNITISNSQKFFCTSRKSLQ
jgi:hypothetical protein